MANNKNFDIKLISGISPSGDFPLVDAEDIVVYENNEDVEGVRLPDKLKTLGISETEKNAIIDKAFDDIRFTTVYDSVFTEEELPDGGTKVTNRIETLETAIDNVDMSNLKMTYKEDESILYLHDKKITPNFNENNELTNADDIYAFTKVSDNNAIRMHYDKSGSRLYLYDTPTFDIDNYITSVEIQGGSGVGGLGLNIFLTAMGSQSFATKLGEKVEIQFKGILKDSDNIESNGLPIEYDIFINNNLVETLSGDKYKSGETISLDVTKYITSETVYSVIVQAKYTDKVQQETGEDKLVTIKSGKVAWTVQAINLGLVIGEDLKDRTKYVQTQDLKIDYTLTGNIKKTTRFEIKGENDSEYTTYMEIDSTEPGFKTTSLNIAKFNHGSYSLRIYTIAILNGVEVSTDAYTYTVMFGKTGNTNPILRLVSSYPTIEQYSELPLSFTIYQENTNNHEYTLYEKYINDDGEEIINTLEKGTIANNVPNDNAKYYTEIPGSKTIILESRGKTVELQIEILPSSIEIDPVLNGLALDFSPKGRNNSTEDYNIFYNNVFDEDNNEIPITWELSDNFDWVNGGWQTDENNNSFFCVKAGTTATINYNLFEDTNTYSTTTHGKEFKIIFKTSNVTDTSNAFLSCSAPADIGTKNVGIVLKPHEGTISSNFDVLELPYSEEDIIELDFNITPFSAITPDSVNIPMIMTYEDGTPFRPLPYTSANTSFSQENPVPIIIGSPTCDVHIYRMKAYKTYLADELILNNFILDSKNGIERKERYLRNKISFNGTVTENMIANGQVAEPLKNFAKANPQLRVIGIEAPHFTKSKANKVPKSKFYYFYEGGRTNEDNWVAENCIHNGQGTSSDNYRFAGKNLDLNMKQKAGTVYTIIIEVASGLYDKDGKFYEKGAIINEAINLYTSANKDTREEITFEELQQPNNGYATVITEEVEGSIITLADGTVTDKITLTESSVPVNYLNIKVNVASSENANNALLAKRYNRFLPYTSGAAKRDPLAKNTMEFYNCVIFIRETNEDMNSQGVYLSHQEFNDTNWHFYAIGNVGDSKKTDSTRVTDKKDDNEFCQEILDVTRPLARFPINPIMKASEILDKEGNAPFLADPKHLSKLLEYIDYKYVPTTDTDFVEGKVYYIDMLEHDDYSGQFTYEPRYATDNQEELEWPLMKAKWNEFYRFIVSDLTYDDKRLSSERKDTNLTSILKAKDVFDADGKNIFLSDAATYLPKLLEYSAGEYIPTKDTTYQEGKTYYVALLDDPDKVKKWKEDFEKWFIKESAFYYYLFTLRYTMVDNWAKNSFWHYGKNANGSYKFEFWDYDNDTALGIDNTGTLKMPYGVEGQDRDENGGERFRASDSTFFTRLVKYFSKEINDFYETIQENSQMQAFNSNNFIEEFDSWQQQFPEALWRWDYNRKYKRTYIGGYGVNWDNAKNPLLTEAQKASDGTYLKEMMYGRKKYQRRQFERNQGFYMGSKFNDSQNKGDKIELRFGNPGEDVVVKPNYTLSLTPYLNMYLNVYNGNNRYFYGRCNAGVPVEIPYPGSGADFIYIHGASNLQSTGDLSLTYTDIANFSGAGRLKDIVLGTDIPGFKNGFLATLGIDGSNKALETLNIQNYINEQISTPKIEDLINLKYLYAQGSKIQTVEFANRGLIEEAYLPESISAITALNLYNFHILECEGYDNLASLVIDNCPKIAPLTLNIVKKAIAAKKLNRVRITDINWTIDDSELLESLYNCTGYEEDGKTKTPKSYLSGVINLTGKITRYNLTKYRETWPKLILNVDESFIIEQQWLKFYNEIKDFENGQEPLVQFLVNRETRLEEKKMINNVLTTLTYDPTVNGNLSGYIIDKPKKPNSADGQFKYEFSTWARSSDGIDFANITVADQDIVFYAKYTSLHRTYTVQWLNGDGSVKGFLSDVDFGSNVRYEDANDFNNPNNVVSGLPVKAPGASTYYIFSKWDRSTASLKPMLNEDGTDYLDIVKINPIFEESNALNVPAKIDRENGEGTLILTPADLYAVSKYNEGRLMNSNVFNYQNSPGKDEIKIQLGYMPAFDNVEEEIIIDKDTYFNGTDSTFKITNIHPFAEDNSFTLALDFTPYYGNGDSNKYLVSAYSEEEEYGFNILTTDKNSPKLTWGEITASLRDIHYIPYNVSDKVPKAKALDTMKPKIKYREICVIRKIKGDSNLYLYTNNRYSLEEVQKQILTLPVPIDKNNISAQLCFGGKTPRENGALFNESYAKGMIHYAKIWWDDLGESECQKICSWTYEKMNFIYSNSFIDGSIYNPRYRYANGGNCIASFIAKDLLPEQIYFHNSNIPFVNYHDSNLKTWMLTKFIKAFPVEWQQVINPVQIPAIGEPSPSSNSQVLLDRVVTKVDKIYIPSVIEIDSTKTNEVYNREGTQANYSPYPQFINNSSRIYKLPDTDTPIPWILRSPTNNQNFYRRNAVDPDGKTDFAYYLYKDQYGSEQQWQPTQNALYGVLIGFSI